jgi:hypothetical protein
MSSSALFTAATSGDLLAIREALACGVAVNRQNDDGETALHLAMYSPVPFNAASILLKAGVNPNLQDDSGKTPLMLVFGWRRDLSARQKLRLWSLFEDFGADIAVRNDEGENLFNIIREQEHDTLVETTLLPVLMAAGISSDPDDWTRTRLKTAWPASLIRNEFDPHSEADWQEGMNLLYAWRLGEKPDLVAAAACFERSARGCWEPACTSLGRLYEQGLGVPHDPHRAFDLYVEGAKGFHDLNVDLARAYARGIGVKPDQKKALAWYAHPHSHDVRGWHETGRRLRDGIGIKAEPQRALRWFRRAAKKGHAEACLEVIRAIREDPTMSRQEQQAAKRRWQAKVQRATAQRLLRCSSEKTFFLEDLFFGTFSLP